MVLWVEPLLINTVHSKVCELFGGTETHCQCQFSMLWSSRKKIPVTLFVLSRNKWIFNVWISLNQNSVRDYTQSEMTIKVCFLSWMIKALYWSLLLLETNEYSLSACKKNAYSTRLCVEADYFFHFINSSTHSSSCIWLPPPTTTQFCGSWAEKAFAKCSASVFSVNPIVQLWDGQSAYIHPLGNGNLQTWIACYSLNLSNNRNSFSSLLCMNNRQRDEDNLPPAMSSGLCIRSSFQDDSLSFVVHFPIAGCISHFILCVRLCWCSLWFMMFHE